MNYRMTLPSSVLGARKRAAVAALAKSLANELAGKGIRVNQLMPGRIGTERVRELDETSAARANISVEDQRKRAKELIPLRWYGRPEEFGRGKLHHRRDASGGWRADSQRTLGGW
jgi:3-oxoacyl-[acyl-carrier protein] reductase